MYKCYLNGKFYGQGNLDYMRELFVDYIVTCKMYGKVESNWRIVDVEKENQRLEKPDFLKPEVINETFYKM